MKPVCSRCSQEHYNFVPCAKAAAWNAQHEKRAPTEPLDTILKPPAGFRPWGDRLQSWERHGNVYYRKDNNETQEVA